MKLRCRETVLDLNRVALMGVLNVTPDSFSDGGRFFEADIAVERAAEIFEQGATIVDIGGESTRPGAKEVPEAEEMRRVLPVIERVAAAGIGPISVDTRKASVARAAIEAGASIVNDTLGEEPDDSIVEVAIAADAGFVTMHSRGTPATMKSLTDYGDVVADVKHWLEQRAKHLEAAGLASDQIVLDPGFGFAKKPEHNLEMLNRFEEFTELAHPILAGTSRKSFVGFALDLPEDERLEGTAATVAIAVYKGARLVRVHDVREMARVVRMVEAIRSERIDTP